MEIYPEFQEFFRSLNTHRVEYVIVGAYALAYHGVPRATQDLDILIAANPDNADRVLAALDAFGFGDLGIEKSELSEPKIFFRLGREPRQIDILTYVLGVDWDGIWQRRQDGDYGDQPVSIISPEDFIKAKLAAGRPQDIADAKRLMGDSD